MGKKKKDKKGKGAEKTAQKTENKAEKKSKKLAKEQGEDDIEALIAQFKDEDRKRVQVVEEKCPPPSPRCQMTIVGHPDRDELIMFGGQYCNGARTTMYNEMYIYNIRNNEWSNLSVPNAPPPRCSHQAVVLRQGGGQMWVFGGEFESPKQLQFYHYNDLWCYHIKERRWEKINAKGGPSSRSGHRMVVSKRQLIVFGGFYDVGDYKYFNDIYAFNLDTYKWTKIEASGQAPAPRSGCVMSVLQDQQKILVYGGYSREKLKKDAVLGKTHTDMFLLVPEVKEKDPNAPVTKWKWVTQKQSGIRPTGRCGLSIVPTPGNRALVFGGVKDEDEDEEQLTGVFYNDMYSLELDKGKWHQIELRGKQDKPKKKRRRKKSPNGTEVDEETDEDDEDDEDVDEDVKRLKVSDATETDDGAVEVSVPPQQPTTTFDDGVFTVTVGGAGASSAEINVTADDVIEGSTNHESTGEYWPSPRMNAALAVRGGMLYLYGGLCEDGDRQLTLADFYALDLHKLDQWKVLIKNEAEKQEWLESESDSDDSDNEEEGAKAGKDEAMDDEDEDSDDDDDDDDESDMELGEAPSIKSGESVDGYFTRNKDYWMLRADDVAEKEGLDVSTKQLKKAAQKMAKEFFQSETEKEGQ